MPYREPIREFILEKFLFSDNPADLDDSESLVETAITDSTGILELAVFLGETFNIDVKNTDIVPENFDSVERVVAFVERKITSAEVP